MAILEAADTISRFFFLTFPFNWWEQGRSLAVPVPMMETWVLIPPELCLVPTVVGGLGGPSARVWTRVAVAQGRRWSPFQGTVRLGVMPSADAGVAPANGLNASPSLPVESDVSPSSRYLVFVSSLRIKYQKSVRAWGFSFELFKFPQTLLSATVLSSMFELSVKLLRCYRVFIFIFLGMIFIQHIWRHRCDKTRPFKGNQSSDPSRNLTTAWATDEIRWLFP